MTGTPDSVLAHAERDEATMLQDTTGTSPAQSFSATTIADDLHLFGEWYSNTGIAERPTQAPTSAVPTIRAQYGTQFSSRPTRRVAPILANPPTPTVETTSSDSENAGTSANDSSRAAVDQPLDTLHQSCPLQKAQDPSAIITVVVVVLGLILCLAFLRRCWAYRLQTVHNDSQKVNPILSQKSANEKPSQPIRRPSSASFSSSQNSKWPSESTLILIAWILFTFDHISLLSMFVTLLWICPQFNCWVKPPAQTPGCPVPELFLSTHVFLSLGASVFVLATLQRFLRVYSLLSRKRYMFLCACTVLVVLVLIGRLGAIAFWTLVRLSSFDTWAVDSPMRKLAHQVNRISYLVFFLTMTSLALVALLLGLQFVLNVRANLARVAHQSPPLPSLPAHSGSTASNGDDVPHKRKLHHQQIRHNRRIVIGWIILSILMLCNFGFVGLVLKDQLPKPANLFNSLLLMLVKMLVAAVSMAMSEVVKLATATDHGENSGRS